MTGTEYSGIRIEEISSIDEIKEEEWNNLLERSEGCSIFQSYEWIHSWWESFKEDRNRRPFILSVRLDAKLVGLAPLFVEKRSSNGKSKISLHFLGEKHADYLNFLIDEERPSVLDLLLERITSHRTPWDYFFLNDLPEHSRLSHRIQEISVDRRTGIKGLERTSCPGINISGNEEEVRKLLEKKSLKRHKAGISKIGKLNVNHLDRIEDIIPFLEDFFQQHINRWAATPSPSLFIRQQNCLFYQNLVKSLGKQGKIIFTVLQLDDHNIAYHFGLISGDNFIWYKPTFDISVSRYSPGEILLRELLLMSLERGFREFDFSRGKETFKMRFSNHVDYNTNFIWYRKPAEMAKIERREKLYTLLKDVVIRLHGKELASRYFHQFKLLRAHSNSKSGPIIKVLKFLTGKG